MQSVAGEPYKEGSEVYRRLSFDQHIHPGMPRIFFMEAEWEHMFWPHQKIALAKKIAALKNNVAVKIYKNMEHGFLFNFDRPHQVEGFEDFLKYIEKEPIAGLDFEA
jgi:acetyl esterase/lipase